ncbi:MAG: 5-(carboxyamino)imidazole ribonucleotide synthase [Pseudomonadota bacterium]
MAESAAPLPPGAVIGILGGGQLGRMAALAAARLGYQTHIYCPEAEAPARQVTTLGSQGAYDDEPALLAFAQAVDVVTFEFENVPASAARRLAEQVTVRPRPEILHLCRNRLREKGFCNANGVPTAPYAKIPDRAALDTALAEIGAPCVLKTSELGYDGKGQVTLQGVEAAEAAWQAVRAANAEVPAILEGFVEFRCEISVIVARGPDGSCRTYEPVENRHKNHILHQTVVPAEIPQGVARRAEEIARLLAEKLELVGLLAIEMFVTKDEQVLVNELAPRPHNSGHWSLDAAATSQFEQFIRAVAGLPLGDTARLCPAVMTNLLGDEADDWATLLAEPDTKLHLYGKTESRPGRKMGHVTRLQLRA